MERFIDWLLSPLTRRIRREVEAALAKDRERQRQCEAMLYGRTKVE